MRALESKRLNRLLRPRSIAVFGGRQARAVVEQSERMGFAGDLWPVHPTLDSVAGRACYRSVADLPGAPDVAFVGVNRQLTIGIVRDLAARDAGGAVCFASGFREAQNEDADAAALERALLTAAGDMPLIGPNCYGLINYLDGALLWPDQHGGRRIGENRGAAIVMQSSNMAINLTMQTRGLPLAYLVTVGNQAQIGLAHIASALLDDERVSCLGLHVEGFGDIRAFEALAEKARRVRKPVVAIKVGKSPHAQAAALSHTASLAGTDAASCALLKRLGVARVHSLPALIETLKLLHVHGPLDRPDLTSMSCSGGEASMVADAALSTSVRFMPFAATQQQRIKKTLGPLVTVANPLDYHTYIWNNEQAMTETFAGVLSGDASLNCLVLDYPRSDRCDPADWLVTERAFVTAVKNTDARGAVVSSLPENLPEEKAGSLMAMKIAPLAGIDEALAAADAAAFIGAAWRKPFPARLALGASNGTRASVLFDEADAKRILSGAGVPVPAGQRVLTPEDAARTAETLGFPVALKALGIAHKSEAGGVVLGLASHQSVLDAAQKMMSVGDGLLVEKMVQGCIVELIAGVTRDPVAGLLLTLGAGGVLVELLDDSTSLLLPATEAEIRAALAGLKCAPLLAGYRGKPAADLDAAVRAICAIADFAVSNAARIVELDVNPLIVRQAGHGAFAADVLLHMEKVDD
jgi:acetate---CoA ligase (ADP-forming)